MSRFDPTLMVLTDRALSAGRSHAEVVRRALAGGATVVQYREKAAPAASMVEEAAALVSLCRPAGVPLVVNDHLEVARQAGADGVHLGQSDLDPAHARSLMGELFVVGVSVRTTAEARSAAAKGATYLAANGVFATATKTGLGPPLGIEGLRLLVEATPLPVVAIGGITPANAAAVVEAGAAGVAVVSCVVSAPDIEGACARLLRAIAEGRQRGKGRG